jgi:hypothetical protein
MKDFELVQEWLRYAHNDLISVRHLCENIYPKQTALLYATPMSWQWTKQKQHG